MKIKEFGAEHKDVILLLHGGGLSWWNYQEEAELLGEQYHVVLPVLDGHADSDDDFVSIGGNARRIISYIDEVFGGSVLVLGGLSLGAQIAAEILSLRNDICRFAVLESASVIPSKLTYALTDASVSSSFGLIEKKWFSKLQFRYLRIREDLFDAYYRDSVQITKENMIAFLKASVSYEAKESLGSVSADVRIVAGGREQGQILKSAKLLNELIPHSRLEIKDGLYHGEYSINHAKEYADDLLSMMKIGRE